jgi:SNF2 family DNA or RNA helicase
MFIMKQQLAENIKATLRKAFQTYGMGGLTYKQGQSLYLNGQCALLSESGHNYRFSVDDKYGDFLVNINYDEELALDCTCKSEQLCKHKTASLLQLDEYFRLTAEETTQEGIKYTRKGMIQRVIEERRKKAQQANYEIDFADNIFGEHILTNERGTQYHITFRDIERRHGYCNCPDYSTNKLGTCKHLIFAFNNIKQQPDIVPPQLPSYPFIEVFLNPFRNNKISYFYPEKLRGPIAELFYRYFGNKNFIEEEEVESFPGFLNNTHKFKQILVRPEVLEKVKKVVDQAAIARLKKTMKLDFGKLKAPLLPFQQAGVEFATFSAGVVLADDLELGKITQAVATALMKKKVFGFSKTLVVCQAAMKQQWKREVERLSGEAPLMPEGSYEERNRTYQSEGHYFIIVNYETVIQDVNALINLQPDFLILDEAQRIKSWSSAISSAIRTIARHHTVALAGSPFESKLIELYALMMLVDKELLSPLWEFSYKYCYFDDHNKNNIVGYHNLDELMKHLEPVLLRREKYQVIKQLPQISTIDVPVEMHPYQLKLCLKYAGELLDLINKNSPTPFEHQQALQLIRKLRMIADSSFLVDDLTNISPKNDELKTILIEKLNIRKSRKKVIIFTEWKKMVQVISRSLRLNKIKHVAISEDSTAKQRETILKTFEKDDECNVLVAGNIDMNGSNIHLTDVVINFDIAANRESKSIRMGSLDNIIQRKGNLTIINLVAKNSIEEKIAGGMELDAIFKTKKKADSDLPAGFPKVLQTELIGAIKEIIGKINLAEAEKITLDKTDSAQMSIDFSTEEAFDPESGLRSAFIKKEGIKMLEKKLEINPAKLNQALSGGAQLIAQMLKLSSGKEIDVAESARDFDAETGEITLRYRVSEK